MTRETQGALSEAGIIPSALNRRHFLAGVAAAAGAALLAACGGSSSRDGHAEARSGATSAPAAAPAAAHRTAPATSGSAAAPTTAAAAAPTTAAAAGGKGKTLKMSRNAEPQSVAHPLAGGRQSGALHPRQYLRHPPAHDEGWPRRRTRPRDQVGIDSGRPDVDLHDPRRVEILRRHAGEGRRLRHLAQAGLAGREERVEETTTRRSRTFRRRTTRPSR